MLNDRAREKVLYNIRKSQFIRDERLFKKLNDEIWEFRTFYNGKAYRLFAFWDKSEGKNVLVVATHGIVKKSQKTPTAELRKAEVIRTAYFKHKGLKP